MYHLRQELGICLHVMLCEVAKDDSLYSRCFRCLEECEGLSNSCTGSMFAGVTIDSTGDGGEGYRLAVILDCETKGRTIAGTKERFRLGGVSVDGANSVHDLLAWQVVGVSDFCGASFTPTKGFAFCQETPSSCTVDCTVDTTSSKESGICSIDNGIDFQFGDVMLDQTDFVVVLLVRRWQIFFIRWREDFRAIQIGQGRNSLQRQRFRRCHCSCLKTSEHVCNLGLTMSQ